jgi:hypothetical protein
MLENYVRNIVTWNVFFVGWKLSTTYVIPERFLARHRGIDKLQDQAETDDPQANKTVPEIILESCNVLQMKDVQVAHQGDCIKKK